MAGRHSSRVIGSIAALTAVVAVTAGCGGSAPSSAAQSPPVPCGGAPSGAATVASAAYVMTLVMGAVEAMYSESDVTAHHPTTGEVMLRGQMNMQPGSSMSGMSMGGSVGFGQVRHLEVHICTHAGNVVTDANPAIFIADLTSGSTADVPVAVMQGVTSGTADLHYGNNVAVTAGDPYQVRVTVGGTTALFHVTPS